MNNFFYQQWLLEQGTRNQTNNLSRQPTPATMIMEDPLGLPQEGQAPQEPQRKRLASVTTRHVTKMMAVRQLLRLPQTLTRWTTIHLGSS